MTSNSVKHRKFKISARKQKRKNKLNASFYSALSEVNKNVSETLKNTLNQIESFLSIQHFLDTGTFTPAFHGWPISPDFPYLLLKLLNTEMYDAIIEFGSGTSTWLIASALEQITNNANHRGEPRKPWIHLAFEHELEYFKKTKNLLLGANISTNVQFHHTPLKKYSRSGLETDVNEFPFYDCQHILDIHTSVLNLRDSKVLIVVDGPPASTGPFARYPALPLVLDLFPKANIDLLLDDYIRADEKQIMQKWIHELTTSNVNHTKEVIRLEKDACLLKVRHNNMEKNSA
jgi:hypothetical protein